MDMNLVGAMAAQPDPVDAKVREKARQIVGPQWFLDSRADRITYGRDCWPLGILWTRGGKIFQYNPDFIVIPETREQIVELVELAAESGTPVIPYGAGSGVCGGTWPTRGGFTLDVKRLDRTVELDPERLTARVGAGAIGMHLEADLNRRGFTFGHYPSSLFCSSVGGYLAGRSAGQLSSRFGKIEDMCLSLEVVAGTGEVIETAQWRPDLTQLIIGSEGTLGVITEGTLRVEPAPEDRAYRGFQYDTLEAALGAIRRMVQAGFRPAVVRLYDAFDSLMAKHKGGHGDEEHDPLESSGLVAQLSEYAGDRIGVPLKSTIRRAARGLMRRALGSPMLLNKAVNLLPFGTLLVVGFEGPASTNPSEAAAAWRLLAMEGEDLGPGPGEHWFQNRFNVSYKQSPMLDLGAFVDTMEVSTTWDNLLNLYREVRAAVRSHAFIMAHFSHVYPEGSSIYFTFAGFAPDGEPIEKLYMKTWEVATAAVRRAGASVAHHHGVGLSKAAHLCADHSGGQALNQILKDRFDPRGIMNPGKLWDVPQMENAS